jgi:hypothetical protein
MAGVYETYDGEIVTLLDERNAACRDKAHQNGSQIPELAAQALSSDVGHHPNRTRES